MIRRVLAALVAVVLAGVGIFLVINYANNADARALEGMETDNVYVAVESIRTGTTTDDLQAAVETKAVPRQFQVEGAIKDLSDLEGRVAVADIVPGEQLQQSRFATPDELRSRGDFELPEAAQNLHQMTIPLDTARALGGNVAAGDTVGVIMSFDATFEEGLYVDADGNVQWNTNAVEPDEPAGEETGGGSVNLAFTKLVLEKVLVTQVQGGYVPQPPPLSDEEVDGEEGVEGPADQVLVTLALDGGQSEQLAYAMEFGTVWLTDEPEGAEEDDDDIKVIRLPERAGDVLE